MIRYCGVQFGQGRQSRRLVWREEVVLVEAADGGDPLAGWYALGTGGVDGLDVGDGVGVLQGRVVAGSVAHQHDVVVIVDDAGHDGAAVEVDDPLTRPLEFGTMAHLDEPTTLDAD
jgi:hypothetical protein